MFKAFLILAMLLCANSSALTQIRLSYLIVSDNGSGSSLLSFGYMTGATCGIDSFIPCEGVEQPPPPPAGVFDARWLTCNADQGRKCDVRGYRFPTTIDTFRVKFQPSDAGFPVSFRWDREAVESMCDSAWLTDLFGGFLIKVRMDVDSQLTISNPVISDVRIILFGQDPFTAVEDDETSPGSFVLHQNHPNPFNPATTISFSVGTYGHTSLRVYDILGREVATLVNEKKEAGEHRVQFEAEGLPSGIYVYRLETSGFSSSRKMVILK